MKYLPFVFKNLFRNKMRTLLTIILTAVIFFFVATLLSILENFENASNAGEGQNRLGVQSAISLANMLPFAHEQKIASLPGVAATAKMIWVGAYYKDQRNFFANFAIDHDKMTTVWDDYVVPPDQMKAFLSDRQGAIVGPGLVKRFGWKVGERVVLTGAIFPFNPEVNIRGIYTHKVDDSSLFFRMDYFQQSMGDMGQTGMIWLKVQRPEDMARISQAIDDSFQNSEYPTETFTEKEFQQQFISMIGNIKLLFNAVSICSIFMVILLAAITMSMTARERVTEIAVLKAIGYDRRLVLTLMLTEFTIIAGLGGLLAGVGSRLFYRFVDMTQLTQGFLVNFFISGQTVAFCILASALVGVIAGGLPAMRSANMHVVDGLRKVI